MAKRKKKGGGGEGEGGMERWLISYADFITLLMVFFVVMYAMSKVDVQKYSAMANSLSLVLSGQSLTTMDSPGPSMIQGTSGQATPAPSGSAAENQRQMDEVKELIEEFIRTADMQAADAAKTGNTAATRLSENIIVYEQERGLVISFKDTMLFPSGSDQLTAQAQQIITELGTTLLKLPNYIRVEGHTDNRPINTVKFPSNWELSALRASNVVHVLREDSGVPADRLSIIGYGEYRPLVSNDSEIGRAMNRRVDIVILKKKYDYFEPPRAPNL
ncbi:MAG: flagellar motor protein MotB [Syntrophomonadaceae bacterium]|nr:flagellar motor protein MotB [Syntrophomonadaceae bacterium]